MATQIYAGNLSYSMTVDNLKELFEQHGEVTSAKIVTDRESGRSKGFGFVEMASDDAARVAITSLNDSVIQGRNIRVNFAKPRKDFRGQNEQQQQS
ncbi:MAG TPA: RNA-binding protein [Spirochaetota bacterium]|nr:RNA-binding protein [Spirochaetota bacterium]HPI89468.1 RNA-binding protein [Spirochaetota bacterium]HPR49325.1 RNA-binding protein [Spirochaetota bacterium]